MSNQGRFDYPPRLVIFSDIQDIQDVMVGVVQDLPVGVVGVPHVPGRGPVLVNSVGVPLLLMTAGLGYYHMLGYVINHYDMILYDII